MATVVTKSYNQIEIKTVGADWTAPEYWDVEEIAFIPGAASDKVSIKASVDSGPEIMYAISLDGEPRVQYFSLGGTRMKPMIDLSASTLSAGAKVIFTLAR